jgi:phosphoglycolate phosphatase-like HAD superfamily hydrolase
VDLRDLTPLLTADGPFVTVLVDAESTVEQAADKYELEWKNVIRQLERLDVPPAVRSAISDARGEHADGAARLVVADVATEQVQLAVSLPHAPRRPFVETGTLPRLVPLLEDVTTTVPHVVVLADRTGADVSAYYDTGKVVNEITVKGQTLHLRKVQGGGWSHLRYLHRAENGWATTAAEIVAAIDELAAKVGAELVVAAGDTRELQLIRENLPERLRSLVVEVPGGRGGDGSEPLVRQRIADAVSRHVAGSTLALLAEYNQERGQDKRACEGVEDVVEALRKAQVQTLLVTTGADQDAQLWFGPDPTMLGTTRDEVVGLGADKPKQGPLVEVLLRAAAATGADAQLVPHQSEQAPRGGVGALLRYRDDS